MGDKSSVSGVLGRFCTHFFGEKTVVYNTTKYKKPNLLQFGEINAI